MLLVGCKWQWRSEQNMHIVIQGRLPGMSRLSSPRVPLFQGMQIWPSLWILKADPSQKDTDFCCHTFDMKSFVAFLILERGNKSLLEVIPICIIMVLFISVKFLIHNRNLKVVSNHRCICLVQNRFKAETNTAARAKPPQAVPLRLLVFQPVRFCGNRKTFLIC